MKIVVFGATGMIGSAIVEEAISRGHKVTAVSRTIRDDQLPSNDLLTIRAGDLLDPSVVRAFATGHDAVISAFGPGPSGDPSDVVRSVESIIAGLKGSDCTRALVVGGAGSLEVAPGSCLVDTPEFPASVKPVALAHRDALRLLQREGGELEWSSLSPAARIERGPKTGKFRLGRDRLLTDADGVSRITAADYAIAMIDELEQGRHIRERFSVAY